MVVHQLEIHNIVTQIVKSILEYYIKYKELFIYV